MNLTSFRKVFPQTVPVLAGYVSLGIAFGLLLQTAGFGPLWALASSIFIYAGTAQFLCVSLLSAGASLPQVALLVLALNFRHFFYGLSMITRYRKTGGIKPYLIFALTDETYAIISTNKPIEGMSEQEYYLSVSLLDHSYWVLGSVLGSVAGQFITFNTTGLDFCMTALFAVLVVEQWKAHKNHRPALLGFGVTLLALILLGPDSFLIPALIVVSGLLLAFQKKMGEPEQEAKA